MNYSKHLNFIMRLGELTASGDKHPLETAMKEQEQDSDCHYSFEDSCEHCEKIYDLG